MNDSLGQPDPQPYNLAVWNGSTWELRKITYQGFPPVVHTVFAINDNNVWLDPWFYWDGQNFRELSIDPIFIGVGVNKIWGNDDGIYIVGNYGFIAHRNTNGSWSRIQSGTDLHFLDIYGANNPTTGKQEILAICTRNYPLGKGIYRIEGNLATEISSQAIQWELFGVWFIPNRHYYVDGAGIYEKKFLSDSLWKNELLDITHYGTSGIRGNNLNDVFVAGSFGEFLHFNEISWKSFINETGLSNGGYGRVAVKNNLVVTVGFNNSQAIVLIGRK